MKRTTLALAAGALAMLTASQALADQFLGSYVARMGRADHFASDGYPLDMAAQVVRQDRANVHKAGIMDADDEYDPWFDSAAARKRFEAMLKKSGAMSAGTKRAIMAGRPLVEVQVFRNSVKVTVIGN